MVCVYVNKCIFLHVYRFHPSSRIWQVCFFTLFLNLDLENLDCSNVAPAAPWKQMFQMLKKIDETGIGNSGLKTQKEAKDIQRICQLPSDLISFSCLLKANTR